MNRYLIILMLLIAAMPLAAAAEPEISHDFSTYRVYGTTVNAIRASLNENTPFKGQKYGGKTFDAYTTWHVNWNYRWKREHGEYRLSELTTTLKTRIVMPQWQDANKAPAEVAARWESYRKALWEHELGHREIGVAAAKEIDATLRTAGGAKSGAALSKKLNDTANSILQKHRNIEKQYDVETNHGKNEGARFP